MKEFIARNKLKNWAKDVVSKLHNMRESEYESHKELILKIASMLLMYKARGIMIGERVKKVKGMQRDSIWIMIEEFYSINDFPSIDLDKVDDTFFIDTFSFLVDFIDDNYEYLENILAWLYQYLNINSNDNVNKDTQFFTDQYMVDYLVNNSISELNLSANKHIDCIDPACGGGNFLVSLITKLYGELNYSDEEFITFIENHIYGYDIDRHLSIICTTNIYITLLSLKVVDLENLSKLKINVFYDYNNKYGSLLKDDGAEDHLLYRVSDAKKFEYQNIFKRRYSLVITNPPFKGRREQNSEIRNYITEKYKSSKGDICNAFLERSKELILDSGITSLVMQNGWMYLDSFKELRYKLLTEGSILTIADLGSNTFYDLNGEKANIALLIYMSTRRVENINIYGLKSYKYKEKRKLLNNINQKSEDFYKLNVSDVLNDADFRVEYISTGKIKESFNTFKLYNEFSKVMQGSSTGDSKKFVKYHWEIENDNGWIPVSKGGGYCKWSGLNLYKINWKSKGKEIKEHPKSVIRNEKYFGVTDLVYSDTGTSGLSVRLLSKEQIFIASGPGILILQGDKYCHLAFLNTRLASYYIKLLTPKLTISASYIGKIPVVKDIFFDEKISMLSKLAVELKTKYNIKRPINYEYQPDNYLKKNTIYEYAKNDLLNDLLLELERLELESKINQLVLSYYKFNNEEIKHIYLKVGPPPYDTDSKEIDISVKEIDRIINKSLDANCSIKSNRINKNTLGVEGVLELLAVNHGFSPKKIYKLLINNVEKLDLVIKKYYKHTLHRIKLNQIGYADEDGYILSDDSLKVLISEDIAQRKIKFDIEKWFNEEVYAWHYESFKKRPIITRGDKVNE